MRTLKASLLSLGLVVAFALPAGAQTATFDDVTSGSFSYLSNYKDVAWTNAYVINPFNCFGPTSSAGGYYTALTSGRFVLGNVSGNPLTMSGAQFNLYGGNFSAAWRTGMTLNAVGSLNGASLYDRTFTIDWAHSTYLDLDMVGVDNVVFTTSGGTTDTYASWSDYGFAADNFEFDTRPEVTTLRSLAVPENVVPEPMSVSLMGFGLLAVGAVSARRKRGIAK